MLLIAGLTAITFLIEGAILHRSALLITSRDIVPPSHGGVGYMLFSVAMTAGGFRVTPSSPGWGRGGC